jgi:hypothetical protein
MEIWNLLLSCVSKITAELLETVEGRGGKSKFSL